MARRTRPYTVIGIRRKACVRCGKPARFQWQVCADGRQYRPICLECDIALNLLVTRWMNLPHWEALSRQYEAKIRVEERKVPKPAILFCPNCGGTHIDKGYWIKRPHHTHLCEGCGHKWREEEYLYGIPAGSRPNVV